MARSARAADLTNVSVGIAVHRRRRRRAPPACVDVEPLYLDMIARARRLHLHREPVLHLGAMGEALAARLAEPDGPGDRRRHAPAQPWLARGGDDERAAHAARAQAARRRPRTAASTRYFPHIAGLAEGTCVDLHSKVMIVDDEWLRIGSSNLSNRSMGVDTECDVAIEAQGGEAVQRGIRAFRDRLLAEHAGASVERTTSAIASAGNIAGALPTLGSDARRLETLEAPELPESVLGIASIGDPEKPVSLEGLVRQIAPDTSGRRHRLGPHHPWHRHSRCRRARAVWRLTPLADIVTPKAIVALARNRSPTTGGRRSR